MEDLTGIDPMRNTRKGDVVSARMMVAHQLMSEGFTSIAVAEIFGKNHSTILHYKDRMINLFLPGWEAEMELWNKFKRMI